jgi:hypothetical protein
MLILFFTYSLHHKKNLKCNEFTNPCNELNNKFGGHGARFVGESAGHFVEAYSARLLIRNEQILISHKHCYEATGKTLNV